MAKRESERALWSEPKGNIRTRTVKAVHVIKKKDPSGAKNADGTPKMVPAGKRDLVYEEVDLVDIKDPVEAIKLLKLKPLKAVRALVIGANAQRRKSASSDTSLIKKLAEAWGVSMDEARTTYNSKKQ